MVIDDSPGSGELGLAPSALIARLRLQVRSARRELAEARAQLDALNDDVERDTENLRDRLLALVAERRAEIDTRLQTARATAVPEQSFVAPAARLDEASHASEPFAAVPVSPDATRVASTGAWQLVPEDVDTPPHPINPFHPVYGDDASYRHADQVCADDPWVAAREGAEVGPDDHPSEVDPWTAAPVVWGEDPTSSTHDLDLDGLSSGGSDGLPAVPSVSSSTSADLRVVLDSSGFAEVFAAALAAALAERPLPTVASIPTSAPQAPRRSFWAGTWHADVVLSLVSLLIVIVILIAWAS